MGYIRHHAIIVTGRDYGEHKSDLSVFCDITDAHREATNVIFGSDCVSDLSVLHINCTRSFCIWPDGSKEGWAESDDGDGRRNAFITWLRAQYHEDGSSPVAWAEVQFGDDANEACIVRSSDDDYKERLAKGEPE